MRRRNVPVMFAIGSLVGAAVVAALGLVMTSNASFAKTYVRDQLSQQNITFKSAAAMTEQERASACLMKYAGQRLTTGKQAECYANDFIGLHVKTVANGQTYAQLGDPERALSAQVEAARKNNDPASAELQKQHAVVKAKRDALFQGETSRGLLLTSFGFSDLGAKAGQAATVAFGVSALLVLLSVAGFVRGSMTSATSAKSSKPEAEAKSPAEQQQAAPGAAQPVGT